MNVALVGPGDILAGKYRVERVLGSGNMGVVVAATHMGHGQLVALKLMLPGRTAGPEQRERFLREARAAVRLRSQYVARVLDVDALQNGAPYIAMEFLDGQDLAALLQVRGPLPYHEATEYVLQACEAVGEAHAVGIVHRDLKPANLFLTEDVSGSPCIKVLDFGVSKLVGDLTLTNNSQALGSPLYMSPEQMNSSRDVDARSDLWALGVSLYQLVAGRTPFHADTIQALCTRVFFGRPTPLGEYRSNTPPEFEAVILRCLERDPERRWRDVAEFAAALVPHAPAGARMYAERVSRVLRAKRVPTPSPELPAVVPALTAVSTPVPGSGSSSAGAGGSFPTGTALIAPPVAASSSALATTVELPPILEFPRATIPCSPGASSDSSHVLSAAENTSPPASYKQRTHLHSRAPFVVTGFLVALTVTTVGIMRFVSLGDRVETGADSSERLQAMMPLSTVELHAPPPASTPDLVHRLSPEPSMSAAMFPATIRPPSPDPFASADSWPKKGPHVSNQRGLSTPAEVQPPLPAAPVPGETQPSPPAASVPPETQPPPPAAPVPSDKSAPPPAVSAPGEKPAPFSTAPVPVGGGDSARAPAAADVAPSGRSADAGPPAIPPVAKSESTAKPEPEIKPGPATKLRSGPSVPRPF
ncbi:protein kinase domain-containing protein [Sorangium sp. So ce131]|uniref:serine/threonine-protein kinase n=1 Tax=Sorangium sp. So ce131 TaxID=3133282 RepID=UPI003F5E5E2E